MGLLRNLSSQCYATEPGTRKQFFKHRAT